MTKLPTSGGAWTRDDRGGLKQAEAPTVSARGVRQKRQKPAPSAKPEQKDSDK